MSGSYAGNPASYPANITTITDGDAPSGATFSTPLEQLADRTAFIEALLAEQIANLVVASQALNWPERASIATVNAANADLAMAWLENDGANKAKFVLLDGTKVLTAMDGIQFNSPTTLANGNATKPEIAAGMLDAVPAFMTNGGVGVNFYTSLDGYTFTLRAAGPPGIGGGIPCYSSSLNRWVSVNTVAYYAPATTAGMSAWVAGSVPGTWTASSGGCKRLVWNGALFVALPVSSYNKCLTSPDGITWTERTLPQTVLWSGVAYSSAEGLWMICASNSGTVYTSPDAITWTPAASVSLFVGNDLACYGSLWVMPTVIANGGGIGWSVDNGASWNHTAVGKHNVATAGFPRILQFDKRFGVVHSDGANVTVALSLRAQ